MPTKLIRKQFLLSKEENERIEKEAKSQKLSVSNLTRKHFGLGPLAAGGNRAKTKTSKSDTKATKNSKLRHS